MKAKSFLLLILSTLFLLILATVSINIYVNPYGYYGDKQLGRGELFNSHIAKYYYLEDSKIKPEAIVLGSSNSMRMRAKTIDSLFNLKAFNYGVYQAGIEDFYCISKVLVNDLKIKPKVFIICVDDWNMKENVYVKDLVFEGAQNRLAYKYQFSKYLGNFSWITLFWCQFKSALAYKQINYSLSNLKIAYGEGSFERKNPPMSQGFFEDGTRKKYADNDGEDVTDIAEQGKYKLTEYLKKRQKQALKKNTKGIVYNSNEDFKDFEPAALKRMEELMEFYNENNIKVILNIMPIQPYFQELLYVQQPAYQKRIVYMVSYFSALQKKYKNIILIKDNHEVKNFKGYPDHFFDDLHPTSVNSDLMLISIKEQLKGYAF